MAEQGGREKVRDSDWLVQCAAQTLHFADETVRVRPQADRHYKDPLPQGKSNLLIRPIAGVKIGSQKSCERVHRTQCQLDLVLPFQAWRDVFVRDKRRDPARMKLDLEGTDGGFVGRNMAQKKAKETLFPDVLHLDIGWVFSLPNTEPKSTTLDYNQAT